MTLIMFTPALSNARSARIISGQQRPHAHFTRNNIV